MSDMNRYEHSLQLHVFKNPAVAASLDIDSLVIGADSCGLIGIAQELSPWQIEATQDDPEARAGYFLELVLDDEVDTLPQLISDLARLPARFANEYPEFRSALHKLKRETHFKALGALAQWRAEIRAGKRGQRVAASSTWIMDDLYHAACCEAAALEAQNAGDARLAHHWMERAVKFAARMRDSGTEAA